MGEMRESTPEQRAGMIAPLRLWLAVVAVGILAGALGALFYCGLQVVQQWREAQPWLMAGLPVVGVLTLLAYRWLGGDVASGNRGLLDEIRRGQGRVSGAMAPAIMLSTWATHLCGGSAGAEGAALQLGGGVAAAASRVFRLEQSARPLLLAAGMAAGMAAVFGLPWAAGLLVWEIARERRSLLLLGVVMVSAWTAVVVCDGFGVQHVNYHALGPAGDAGSLSLNWFQQLSLAGMLALLVGGMYQLYHGLQQSLQRWTVAVWGESLWRPFVGALLVLGIAFAAGQRDCLGLGVRSADAQAVTIVSCFQPDVVGSWTWWWKLCLTAVTLAVGFRGGEFTPLCFMGASMGNLVAQLSHAPTPFTVAMAMVTIIAAATRAPLAVGVMAIELFGWQHALIQACAIMAVQPLTRRIGLFS